jgi:hypothetical protein
MGNGEPIIIRGGGSIEITLYKDTFPVHLGNAHVHYNADRNIYKVTVTDEQTSEEKEVPIPEKGPFTIKIYHSL